MKNQKEICLLLTYVLDMYDQNTLPIPLAIREFWKTGYLPGQTKINFGKPLQFYFYINWESQSYPIYLKIPR